MTGFPVRDDNVEAVREKLLQRSNRGQEKYGTTTMRDDLSLSEWLVHLQEELLDAAVYVEAALRRVVEPVPVVVTLPISVSLDGQVIAEAAALAVVADGQAVPPFEEAEAAVRSRPGYSETMFTAEPCKGPHEPVSVVTADSVSIACGRCGEVL